MKLFPAFILLITLSFLACDNRSGNDNQDGSDDASVRLDAIIDMASVTVRQDARIEMDVTVRVGCLDVDETGCDPNATCQDTDTGFDCVCNAGFEGDGATCTNIDDCAAEPCANGGVCTDELGGYRCTCAEGFSGDSCEFDPCGSGIKTQAEECDDGNLEPGDGCDENCLVEWAFICIDDPGYSICSSFCGDGLKATDEPCDDGNRLDGDGCSGNCEIETPLTFACAIANHAAQQEAAPDYWYAAEHGEIAEDNSRQPWQLTWEPILEEVPGCNGLPWSSNDVDRSLKAYKFLIVLDASWVAYYERHAQHFRAQGYRTLESSPGILLDRVSYLYEAQFRVRVGASRVEAFPELLEKCAENNNYVENNVRDETNTWRALEERGIELNPGEAGVIRLGVGSESVYCHSAAPLSALCTQAKMTNQQKPFEGDSGRFNHRAAITLAHELGHFFGICEDSEHPHCFNAHLANEIPDIMVMDGRPAVAAREAGMFFKFMTSCTPVYDELLCRTVKATSVECGVPLTCENGGLDCETQYWRTGGSRAATHNQMVERAVAPRGERLAVRCCSRGSSECESNDLGGVVSVGGDTGCSGLMTWPEADRFCRQASMRLCTLGELEALDACNTTGCDYDTVGVWTGSPDLPGAELVGYFSSRVDGGLIQISYQDEQLMWNRYGGEDWLIEMRDGQFWSPADSSNGASQIHLIYETDETGRQLPGVVGIRHRLRTYDRSN